MRLGYVVPRSVPAASWLAGHAPELDAPTQILLISARTMAAAARAEAERCRGTSCVVCRTGRK